MTPALTRPAAETETQPANSRKGVIPELLAPAGGHDCLRAAIENGADAVYFGVKAHNARARANNFDLDELPEIMRLLHSRGLKGYVTLNTLIFPRELDGAEGIVRRVAEAGTDALIVQDVGLCRLVREVAPDLPMHGSTQMSITSAAGVRLAASLGCERVILARELSLVEINRIERESPLPLEVFIHGALCVAYSGQCLTSEALGGRSANRGECAQACRMPYEVVCDGETVDLGDVKYLLSPQDLAAYDLVPRLMEIGVASLKIEGRLKGPEYVAQVTSHYRQAIDAAAQGAARQFSAEEVRDLELTFSRGFSHGFLDGNDHKVLVRGDYAKKRGIELGRVDSVRGQRVRVRLIAPVKPGDGLVFDADEATAAPEQGGRLYALKPAMGKQTSPHGSSTDGLHDLEFGRNDIDVARIHPGQRLWKTDDPELTRRLQGTFRGALRRTVRLDAAIHAQVGAGLVLEGRAATGETARVESEVPLVMAERLPATLETLRKQLDRLGGTRYELGQLDVRIEGSPLVPSSMLNGLRRALVERLDEAAGQTSGPVLDAAPALPRIRPNGPERPTEPTKAELTILTRNLEQALAAVECGERRLVLEFQDIKGYAPAITALKAAAADAEIMLATPRIEKPGEGNLFGYLARQGADGLLVRNAGGLEFCESEGIVFDADFSMNASNELSVAWLKSHGARRVTASYDLSFDQLADLLSAVPGEWLEVVIHQRMPMFLMEHCVFCAFLSPGTDHTNCGRPCDTHDVKLRDRVGMEHPLKADVGCRNTLYNAVPQTAAEYLGRLVGLGADRLRVEFLDDVPAEVRRVVGLYRAALAGEREARTLWKDLKATSQYGVTRGQLAVL